MENPVNTVETTSSAKEIHRQNYHPAVHFAFVSGILLPLTILPWFLSKRHTASLQARLKAAEHRFNAVHLDLRTALLELDRTRTQQVQVIARVQELRKDFEALQARSEKVHSDIQTTQKDQLTVVSGLQKEVGEMRSSEVDTFREIGRSLGSIAGFIHELELRLGLERRRGAVEQLRRVAVNLQRDRV